MSVLRDRVNAGLRQIYFFVVPSFVVFMLLGDVVVAAIMQTGAFKRDATLQVYAILASFSLSLVASTGTRLFSSTFFALQDTKTPARTAMIRVVLSGVLGYALMYPFDRIHPMAGSKLTLGSVGLGLGASFAAWIEWWMLRRSLRKTVGNVGAGGGILTRMFAASIIAAVAGRGIVLLVGPGTSISDRLATMFGSLSHPVEAVLILGPVGILYLLLAHLMGIPQAGQMMRRLKR